MNVKPGVSAYKIFAKCQKLQKAPHAIYDLKTLIIFFGEIQLKWKKTEEKLVLDNDDDRR